MSSSVKENTAAPSRVVMTLAALFAVVALSWLATIIKHGESPLTSKVDVKIDAKEHHS